LVDDIVTLFTKIYIHASFNGNATQCVVNTHIYRHDPMQDSTNDVDLIVPFKGLATRVGTRI